MTQGNTEHASAASSSSTQSARGWRATLITARAGLQPYAREWNELLAESEADTIFLTWEWISAWLDAVYPDAPLLVVAVRDQDGRLIAIAPFYRSELRLLGLVRYRCLRVIGDCLSGAEYPDVIVRRGFAEQAMTIVMQELAKRHRTWDCIWIPRIAGWTDARERLRQACRAPGLYLHERSNEFAAVALPDTHEAYLGQLSYNRRGQIKRKTRRMQRSHDVSMIRCERQDELPALLTELFELHGRHWESLGRLGSFVGRPAMRRFYERFAPEALRQGWLRLDALRVNGAIKAVQYGYAYGGVYSSVQEGFDPGNDAGVGNVLRNLVFKACIEEGLREYDFLGEYTEHKRRWGAELKTGFDLLIGKRCPKNQVLFWQKVWPTGRYIQQGRPVNEGLSDD